MARNQEKAQSMLYRFREAQAAELGVGGFSLHTRPRLAAHCERLPDAERWRHQVIQEASRKISQIQNAGMSEHQIREVNDEINKLMREKRAWEYRIKELNGPDYTRVGARVIDTQGKYIPGQRGYRYYGRAADLPGVKEHLEKAQPGADEGRKGEPSSHTLRQKCDAEYYGFDINGAELDELRAFETTKEEEAMLIQEQKAKEDTANFIVDPLDYSDLSIPSQSEVESFLLQHHKQALAQRYLHTPAE